VKAGIMTERRKRELFGLLYGFAALFTGLCLLSYSPKDPCLFLRQGLTQPVENWMGPLGATLAGWGFASVGLALWLVFPALASLAARSFMGKSTLPWEDGRARMVLRLAGALIVMVSTAVFFSIAMDRVEIDGESVRSGGILGAGIGAWLSEVLGNAGSLILLAVLLMAALMAAVDFSPVQAARRIARALLWIKERVSDYWTRYREFSRRRKEVAREREQIEKSRTQPEIRIVLDKKEPPQQPEKPKPRPRQEKLSFAKEGYELPETDLLDEPSGSKKKVDQESLLMNARILESKLRDFGVQGEVVEVHPGPVITMYEYRPGAGVKINKIANLADDLAMALSAMSVRLIAPIPGKDVVGIEISNRDRETVALRQMIESPEYAKLRSPLPMALGKSITGEPFCFDLRRAPHLLVAGSTGSGKSVSLNAMIMSVLYRSTPERVRMLMIDPKRLELSVYEGIPHLMHPVIADPKDAAVALKWAVAEMERRYSLLAQQGVRHIDSYNRLAAQAKKGKKKAAESSPESSRTGDTVAISKEKGPKDTRTQAPAPEEQLPLMLVIIDELADLMMVAARDIEESICRLAQMARAAGIHLILATQRPSVDVITGLIKANFPGRMAFKVASKTDSRTILDQNGAERLLGQGDMLFLPPGTSDMVRLHGAYVSDDEIKRVVEFWEEQGEPEYDEDIVKPRPEDEAAATVDDADDKYEAALRLVVQTRQASVSMLQRKLKIGYNRAARIIDQMETEGVVGPSDGVKPRDVLWDPMKLERNAG